MSSDLRGVEVLQNEIEKSKDRLKNFNENIKKLTGFENPGPRARRILSGENPDYDGRLGRGRGRLFGIAKRGLMEEGGPLAKRRVIGGAFSRLGPPPSSIRRQEREDSPYDEDLPNKQSLQSSVIATSRDAKNREEIMQEQTKDKEGMQRNRRMFGLLLGTLNKFKTESKSQESREEQRKKIDKKLEENAEKEKKKYKQETKQLIEEMHLEETRISRLEQKMEMVQEHGDWEREVKRLKNFICTKSKPRIFWLPRQMNSMLENKLKDSNRVVDNMVKDGQVRLEKEIQDVMDRENKREERIKMRLREDGLFQDDDEKGEESKKESDKNEADLRISENRNKSKSSHETGEFYDSKIKPKRRVVIEEEKDEIRDKEVKEGNTMSDLRNIEGEGERRNIELKERNKITKDDEDDDSDSSEIDAETKNGQVKSRSSNKSESEDERYSSKEIIHPSKSKDTDGQMGSDDGEEDDSDKDSRVVAQRTSSKAEKRSQKENTKDDHKSGRIKEKRERSKHSKQSRHKESEEKEGRKKKKNSVGEDDEAYVEKVKKSSRNPTILLGEEEDVEMESENNTTLQ